MLCSPAPHHVGGPHRGVALQWGPGIPPEVTGHFCPPQGLKSLSSPPSTGSRQACACVCMCVQGVSVSVSAWTCPLGPGSAAQPQSLPRLPREGGCTHTDAHTHTHQTHNPPSCSPLTQTTHMSHRHTGTHHRNTCLHPHPHPWLADWGTQLSSMMVPRLT